MALQVVDDGRAGPVALPSPVTSLTPRSLVDLIALGGMLAKSGLMPAAIKTPEAAASVVLKGIELGIPAMAAIEGISIIQGKPTCSATLLLGLVKRAYGPGAIRVAESTAERCVVQWREVGWDGVREHAFTIADATRAGLAGKGTWAAYPAAMLRARCISAVARMAFPEVVGGLYVADELGADVAIDDDGEVVVVSSPPRPSPSATVIDAEPSPTPAALPSGEDWSTFWAWARSIGLQDRAAIAALLGGSFGAPPPAELRQMIEAVLPDDGPDEPAPDEPAPAPAKPAIDLSGLHADGNAKSLDHADLHDLGCEQHDVASLTDLTPRQLSLLRQTVKSSSAGLLRQMVDRIRAAKAPQPAAGPPASVGFVGEPTDAEALLIQAGELLDAAETDEDYAQVAEWAGTRPVAWSALAAKATTKPVLDRLWGLAAIYELARDAEVAGAFATAQRRAKARADALTR